MKKKFLFKLTAVVICCSFLLLSFPLTSAAKRPGKIDNKVLRKPVRIIFNIVPIVDPVDESEETITNPETNPQKLAGTMKGKKVSKGD